MSFHIRLLKNTMKPHRQLCSNHGDFVMIPLSHCMWTSSWNRLTSKLRGIIISMNDLHVGQ